MAKKVQTDAGVSRLDTIVFNWLGYWARIKRTFKYGVFYIVLIGIVALITTWIIVGAPPSVDWFDTLKGTTGTATGVIQTVEIGDSGVEAVPTYTEVEDPAFEGFPFSEAFFYIYLIEAVLIALLGMVFSGWYAKVFMTPVNPLKFAPFAILEPDRLSFRFWICLPSEVFLYNVSTALEYTYDKRYDASIIYMRGEDDQAAEGSEGVDGSANPTHIQTEDFLRLRGVWRVNVPLGTAASKKLLDDFKLLIENGRNPVFKLTVQGDTESGEVVAKEMRYSRLRLLSDYRFVPYHDRGPNGSDKPLFTSFCKVEKAKDAETASSETESGTTDVIATDPIAKEYIANHVDHDEAAKEYAEWMGMLKANRQKLGDDGSDDESTWSKKLIEEKTFLEKYTARMTSSDSLRSRLRDWWLTIHS